MSEEKAYTLKSARSELAKLQAGIEKKKRSIERLKAEIKQDSARAKELNAICASLYQETVQQRLSTVLFKKNLTPDQIDKLVDLTIQMSDNVDDISPDHLTELLAASKPTTDEGESV